MKTRIITALTLFVIMALVLFLSSYVWAYAYDILVLALMIIAGLEMSRALSVKFGKPAIGIIFAFIVVGYTSFRVVHHFLGRAGITTFFAVLAIMVVVAIFYNIISKKSNLSSVISTGFCMLYPLSIMVYLLALNYLSPTGADAMRPLMETGWTYPLWTAEAGYVPNYRIIAIILTLACTSCTDIFALLVGMTFKGPKLAPHVSPKKTISGAIGGLLGSMLCGGALIGLSYTGIMGLTPLSPNPAISVTLYLSLALGVGFATQIGDLIASYIKRYCEIKDYGTVFPGHGGVLDRIDGTIISAVFVFAFFTIMILITEGMTL